MVDESGRSSWWIVPLGVVLSVMAYLLFDLQLWAGTPAWKAVSMSIAMGGAVLAAAVSLHAGAQSGYRRVAVAMVVGPSIFLLAGVAGPVVQALDLAAVKLPLQVALAATPPLLMIGALVLGIGVHRRHTST